MSHVHCFAVQVGYIKPCRNNEFCLSLLHVQWSLSQSWLNAHAHVKSPLCVNTALWRRTEGWGWGEPSSTLRALLWPLGRAVTRLKSRRLQCFWTSWKKFQLL